VLSVRTTKPDVQGRKAVGYGHHQAAIVALDIENHPIGGQKTGTRIAELDVLRGLSLRMTGIFKPSLQGLLGSRMFAPKLDQHRFSPVLESRQNYRPPHWKLLPDNGFRFRVPYGTLLCVSDKPLHGEPLLPRTGGPAFTHRHAGD